VDVAVLTWQASPAGLTIEETTERQVAACKASDKRVKETSEGSKGNCA
jgi:hypothetical protein